MTHLPMMDAPEPVSPPRRVLNRLAALVAAAMVGLLLALAALVAPAAFGLLPQQEAGRLMGRLFQQEVWLSLVLALGLLLAWRQRHRAQPEAPVLEAPVLLLLGIVFCTVLAGFGIQPMMEAARAGQGRFGFAALRAASSVVYAVKLLLWCGLAWRASR